MGEKREGVQVVRVDTGVGEGGSGRIGRRAILGAGLAGVVVGTGRVVSASVPALAPWLVEFDEAALTGHLTARAVAALVDKKPSSFVEIYRKRKYVNVTCLVQRFHSAQGALVPGSFVMEWARMLNDLASVGWFGTLGSPKAIMLPVWNGYSISESDYSGRPIRKTQVLRLIEEGLLKRGVRRWNNRQPIVTGPEDLIVDTEQPNEVIVYTFLFMMPQLWPHTVLSNDGFNRVTGTTLAQKEGCIGPTVIDFKDFRWNGIRRGYEG